MRDRRPPSVTQVYHVLAQTFFNRAHRMFVDQPSPARCKELIDDTISVLQAYSESLDELLQQQRANAMHDALPR